MMAFGSECCKGSIISCGFVSGVVHKVYQSQWNFKKTGTVGNIAIKDFLRV